jgi:hypothetical protein
MPPPTHDQLLRAFLDPALTLLAIADGFGLTITALLAWSRTPEAQADLEAIAALAATRAQVMAAAGLPEAVDNLLRITADLAAIEPDESTPITTRLRLADTARKNTTTLQRLANPPRVPPPAAQSGGRRVVAGDPEAHPRDHPAPLVASA